MIGIKEKPDNMAQELKVIPAFQSEDEEREFWATHDSTEYLDWDEGEEVLLPKLKLSTQTISLRLSQLVMNEPRVS